MGVVQVGLFVLLVAVCGVSAGRGCCMKDGRQYTVGTHSGLATGGVSGVYDLDTHFAYDYVGKRWGVLTRFIYKSGAYKENIYIEDYNEMERMFVSSRSCTIIPMLSFMTSMRRYCVPEEAVHVERTRLGVGEETLVYDTYEYERNLAGNFSAHFKTAVDDDCNFFNEQTWFEALNFNYTSYLTFFDEEDLNESWSVFDQFDHFHRPTCTFRKEWSTIEEDGQRPFNTHDIFHLIKQLQVHDVTAEMDEERL